MKTLFSLLSVSIAGFLFLTACSKQEESTPAAASQIAPAPGTSPATPAAAPAVTDNATKVEPAAAPEVKATADAAVKEATPAPPVETIKAPAAVPAPPAVPAADSSVQAILEQAKGLVADKKYSEALTTLSGLSTASLTAEQQNLVTALKAKISEAMAAKAGNDGLKSIGGLLDRKK